MKSEEIFSYFYEEKIKAYWWGQGQIAGGFRWSAKDFV